MSSEKGDLCGEKSRAGLLVFRLSEVYDVKAGICKVSRKRVSPRKERRRMTESEKVDAPCRGGVLGGRKRIEKERGCPQLTGLRTRRTGAPQSALRAKTVNVCGYSYYADRVMGGEGT